MKNLLKSRPIPTIQYGYKELKAYTNNSTTKAFTSTLLIFAIASLIVFQVTKEINSHIVQLQNHKGRLDTNVMVNIDDFFTEKLNNTKNTNTDNNTTNVKQSIPDIIDPNTTFIAGSVIPVVDDLVDNIKNFASIEEIGNSLPGTGEPNQTTNPSDHLSGNIGNLNGNKPINNDENENTIYSGPSVDVEPDINLAEIASLLVYPKLALKARIEGTVVLKALIGSDGYLKALDVISSDNSLLNDAAIKAIKSYGKFAPALQDNRPVNCWVTIPIKFSLK